MKMGNKKLPRCSCCGYSFRKGIRGFDKWHIYIFAEYAEAKEIFPHLVDDQGYCCHRCRPLLAKYKLTGLPQTPSQRCARTGGYFQTPQSVVRKRPRSPATPGPNPTKRIDTKKTPAKRKVLYPTDTPVAYETEGTPLRPLPQDEEDVFPAADDSDYSDDVELEERLLPGPSNTELLAEGRTFDLVRSLYRADPKEVQRALENLVRAECTYAKKLTHRDGELSQFSHQRRLTLDDIDEFTWAKACRQAKDVMPLTYSSLWAAFPTPGRLIKQGGMRGATGRKRKMTDGEAMDRKLQRVGVTFANILFSANPQVFKRTQTIFGVDFWRQGVADQVFHTLNTLGIVLSKDAAVRHVDSIGEEFDKGVKDWKAAVENDNILKAHPRHSRTATEDDHSIRVSMGSCWDNVQFNVHTTHQTSTQRNTVNMMALAFMFKHRTQSLHLTGPPLYRPMELPPETFIASRVDFDDQKRVAAVVVARLLGSHWFDVEIKTRIDHQYTAEMDGATEIFNLGVIHENPSTTEGTIKIMDQLQLYVPRRDNDYVTMPCHGDGMSIERMVNAMKDVSREPTREARFEGLLPVPQEFHKEMLLCEMIMKHFFNIDSTEDIGTLFHLKQFFDLKSVKADVKSNFYHVWDLLEFAAMCLLMSLTMNETGLEYREVPDMAEEEQEEYILELSRRLVESIWKCPSRASLRRIKQGYTRPGVVEDNQYYPHCTCSRDTGADMIQCCSNNCEVGWFHLPCVGLNEDSEELTEDWYCSNGCRLDKSYVYCSCKQKKAEEMVMCDRGDCKRGEKFHRSCARKPPEDAFYGTWYCSDVCKAKASEDDDEVYTQGKRLLFETLKMLTMRDSVREGNGPGMLRDWRINIVDFWQLGRSKYLILDHWLLGCVAGVVDERLRHEMTWERVANPPGIPRLNRPLDMVNEHLNMEYKEMVKKAKFHSKVVYNRCSRVAGGFIKRVCRLMAEAGLAPSPHEPKEHERSRTQQQLDVNEFVTTFGKELFTFRKGRKLKSLTLRNTLGKEERDPYELGQKLEERTDDREFWQGIREETKDRTDGNEEDGNAARGNGGQGNGAHGDEARGNEAVDD